MRKVTFLVVVLAFAFVATPAFGQGYINLFDFFGGDDVGRWQADMSRAIWMWSGGYYGYRQGGYFYPVYDSYGRPLSKRQRLERGAGLTILGTVVGAIVGGGKGAGYGAAIGGASALMNDSQYWTPRRGDYEVVGGVYPQPVPRVISAGPIYAGPIYTGAEPGAEQAPEPARIPAQFTFENGTPYPMSVYVNRRRALDLLPGASEDYLVPDLPGTEIVGFAHRGWGEESEGGGTKLTYRRVRLNVEKRGNHIKFVMPPEPEENN